MMYTTCRHTAVFRRGSMAATLGAPARTPDVRLTWTGEYRDTPECDRAGAYKSIRYGAAASPIVGSPVGTNGRVDDDARARVRARPLPCSIEVLLSAREDLYDRLLTRGRQ
jgi:hypothetical protein